jgi:DcuC family C4-dicarboxylate transporter
MIDIFAAVVVVVMFAAVIRGAEVRLALLAAGAVLALVAMRPVAWFEAFSTSMVITGLITTILPALGFTAVMRMGHCDQHLVRLMLRPLLGMRAGIVPAVVVAVVLLAAALSSAAATAAATGVVLIPAMIALGVHPAMAAAAVIGGTWGGVFNPGSPHPALIGAIAHRTVIEVILAHMRSTVPATFVYAGVLYLVARWLGEDIRPDKLRPGSTAQPNGQPAEAAPVSLARAAMPVLPLALLIITVPQFGLTTAWLPQGMSVLQAMTVGTVATALVARLKPGQVSKTFFDGMGGAYGGVIGIIIAAGVFIGGLNALGCIDRLIETLKHVQSAVPLAGMIGPFGIAVLSGSGDAATIAFNQAVLPHAESLGIGPVSLGNIAMICGALGRGMSPVAAATAIAAGYAGVSVFDIAKRTALPAIVTAIVVMAILTLFG